MILYGRIEESHLRLFYLLLLGLVVLRAAERIF